MTEQHDPSTFLDTIQQLEREILAHPVSQEELHKALQLRAQMPPSIRERRAGDRSRRPAPSPASTRTRKRVKSSEPRHNPEQDKAGTSGDVADFLTALDAPAPVAGDGDEAERLEALASLKRRTQAAFGRAAK
eukprot:gnl/Dysnectes_brevis/6302_a9679_505.p1 GENE.gnl/Dysnectes_brevis/6302_a9679_505~~gnl/Dysnectes_brevis/6302_a9679_505.p1  ORF type:complete len:133 (+),score=28.75 gnl/Dysnectes_brevis/6302_a9679_505:57-455(+)